MVEPSNVAIDILIMIFIMSAAEQSFLISSFFISVSVENNSYFKFDITIVLFLKF